MISGARFSFSLALERSLDAADEFLHLVVH
jgi:hypothetical protein